MKVIAINDTSTGGGAAQYFRRANTILSQAGHQVTFFTEDCLKTTSIRSAVTKTYRQGTHSTSIRAMLRYLVKHIVWAGRTVQRMYYPAAYKKLRSLLQQEKFDVAHVHNLHGRLSLQLLSLLKAAQIPIVMQVNDYFIFCNNHYAYNVSLDQPCQLCIKGNHLPALRYHCSSHLNDANTFYDFVGRLALRYKDPWSVIDLYLVTSNDSARLLEEWGVSRQKQFKILNPMHFDEFSAPVSIGDELVFYGSDFLVKGTETFLQSLEHVTPGTKIGVYLMRMSPDYKQRLEEIAGRRKLQLRCDAEIRWDTGLREIVAGARAVIVPSQWWVPSENVVYEAMLLGKSVILSQIGGNAELVDEGETGLFFKSQDARGLAACINRLAANRDLAEQLGVTAYHRARQKFDSKIFLTTLETAYKNAIELSRQ